MADEKPTPDRLKKSMQAAAGLTPPRPGLNVAAAIKPQAHAAGRTVPAVEDDFGLDGDNKPVTVALRLGVLGTGQGGGRIAQAFWELGYRRVAAFNTTDSDFDGLDPKLLRFSCDVGGAAKDMQFARNALASRTEDVRNLFTRAWGSGDALDCVFVCACLGGGTGSGTVMPLVKLARQYLEDKGQPPRVGAVIALPSADDGQKIARNAVTAFRELVEEKVSPLIVIDNDRVHALYQPSMHDLHHRANGLVAQLFHLLNRLVARRSRHYTFDRSEFAELLDGGLVVLGSADIDTAALQSPADVSNAIQSQLAESVLATVDIKTGRKAACVFVSDEAVAKTYTKDYFDAGFTMLDRLVGSAHPVGTAITVHRGLYEEKDTQGLQCYTLVAGVAPPKAKLQALVTKAGFAVPEASSLAQFLNVE